MKSSKSFNNISDKLKAQIPKLKPGQVVTFQMLNGVPNPEPDPKERQRQGEVLYGKVQLLTNMRIYDRYQKDSEGNEVGGYVDIGCVDQWNGDVPVKFRMFVPGLHGGSLFQGKFDLVGGKVKDEELYEILWLSPEREGSPCADGSFEVKFKIVDIKADTKSSINKFDNLRKALDIVASMTPADAKRIMASVNQPKYQDEQVLMAKTKEFAMSNVDQFLATYESKDSFIKADIVEAIDAGIIKYELHTGNIKMGDAIVATIKSEHAGGFPDMFTQWINTAENGQDVYNNIKNQMKKKESVV